MSHKKLKDISSEELLNSLNDETLEVQSTPVYDFIERFDLKAGNFKVPARILYALFLKYYPKTLLFEYFNNEAQLLVPYNRRTCEYKLNKEAKLLHYEAVKQKSTSKRTLPNSPAIMKHFNTWMEKQNITKGEKGLPWFIVYDVYRNYCIDIGFKIPKAFITLNNYLRFHFKFINNGSGPVFFIDIPEKLLPPTRMYATIKEKYKITDKKKSM